MRFSYQVYNIVFFFFLRRSIVYSRVIGACPATTDRVVLSRLGNVRATTTVDNKAEHRHESELSWCHNGSVGSMMTGSPCSRVR